jgi:hypothetical protein
MGRPKKLDALMTISVTIEGKDYDSLQTLSTAGITYREVLKKGIEEILKGKGMI